MSTAIRLFGHIALFSSAVLAGASPISLAGAQTAEESDVETFVMPALDGRVRTFAVSRAVLSPRIPPSKVRDLNTQPSNVRDHFAVWIDLEEMKLIPDPPRIRTRTEFPSRITSIRIGIKNVDAVQWTFWRKFNKDNILSSGLVQGRYSRHFLKLDVRLLKSREYFIVSDRFYFDLYGWLKSPNHAVLIFDESRHKSKFSMAYVYCPKSFNDPAPNDPASSCAFSGFFNGLHYSFLLLPSSLNNWPRTENGIVAIINEISR